MVAVEIRPDPEFGPTDPTQDRGLVEPIAGPPLGVDLDTGDEEVVWCQSASAAVAGYPAAVRAANKRAWRTVDPGEAVEGVYQYCRHSLCHDDIRGRNELGAHKRGTL